MYTLQYAGHGARAFVYVCVVCMCICVYAYVPDDEFKACGTSGFCLQ